MGCDTRSGANRWLRWGALVAAIASVSAPAIAEGAAGDTTPIPASPGLPWADPANQTPLELLAGQIASHIAGRPVSVQCESGADWTTVVEQTGGDPNAESGFVATQWNGATGQLVSTSATAELASAVCLPLSGFALATVKPTKCSSTAATRQTLALDRRATVAKRSARTGAAKTAGSLPGPCYLGAGRAAATMPAAYWARYSTVAIAILTLAHESIHLSGIVGGRLANGLSVGDPQAEAKADCYGMQWMPYVAEQLGDTPDDAQAIATYFWDKIYPLSRASNPEYWSPDCRPGGALDTRPAGATAWP